MLDFPDRNASTDVLCSKVKLFSIGGLISHPVVHTPGTESAARAELFMCYLRNFCRDFYQLIHSFAYGNKCFL